MSETYRTEINANPAEENSVKEVIATLSEQEKSDLVIQSFMVASGAIEAHNIYVYFLCQLFSLTPRQGGLLLRECFSTLSEDYQRKVIQASYHRHLDRMKKEVLTTKKTATRKANSIGNFEAATQSIEANLPTILGDNAFNDITTEEKLLITNLAQDFTPSMESAVVQTLRQICADRGYYNDREWYQNQT